jgi:hypothetical protein
MLKRMYRQQIDINKMHKPEFYPSSVRVGFVVDRSGTGTGFSPITSVFPLSVSRHVWSIHINSSSMNTE